MWTGTNASNDTANNDLRESWVSPSHPHDLNDWDYLTQTYDQELEEDPRVTEIKIAARVAPQFHPASPDLLLNPVVPLLSHNNHSEFPIHQFSVDEIQQMDSYQMHQHLLQQQEYVHSQLFLPAGVTPALPHLGYLQPQSLSCPSISTFCHSYNHARQPVMIPNMPYPPSFSTMHFLENQTPALYGNIQCSISAPNIGVDSVVNCSKSTSPMLPQLNYSVFLFPDPIDSQAASTIQLVPSTKPKVKRVVKKKHISSSVAKTKAQRKSQKAMATETDTGSSKEDVLQYVQTLLHEHASSTKNEEDSDSSKPAKRLLQPLSPYNYFYRDERDNIIQGLQPESYDAFSLPEPVGDFSDAKLRQLLHRHWFLDPHKPKRPHRKSHGLVEFERLSKIIAERWRALSPPGRAFYRRVARLDEVYYHWQRPERVTREESTTGAESTSCELRRTKDTSSQCPARI